MRARLTFFLLYSARLSTRNSQGGFTLSLTQVTLFLTTEESSALISPLISQALFASFKSSLLHLGIGPLQATSESSVRLQLEIDLDAAPTYSLRMARRKRFGVGALSQRMGALHSFSLGNRQFSSSNLSRCFQHLADVLLSPSSQTLVDITLLALLIEATAGPWSTQPRMVLGKQGFESAKGWNPNLGQCRNVLQDVEGSEGKA